MQSLIYKKIGQWIRLLGLWFNASVTGRIFNRISAALAVVFSNSLLGKLFDARRKDICKKSLFCKFLLLPVTLCRLFAKKTDAFWKAQKQSSGVVWFLSYWNCISIRTYGSVLFVFSVAYALIRSFTSFPTIVEWCCISALLIISLLMMAINRSFKALFKGSVFLTAFGGLFCEIRKDVDSKLFLKDPEFFLSRPVVTCCIGIIAAIAATLMPAWLFLLLVTGLLYVFLTVQYTAFGVFTVVLAAPILPTMVLVGCCLLCVLSFVIHLATDKNIELRPVPLSGWIVLFMLSMTLSAVLSLTFVKSMQILLIHIAFVLFYFVAFQTLNTKRKWKAAVVSLITVSALVALYGIIQNFTGISGTASWVDSEMFQDIKIRVYSTFDNPNVLGEYLVMMIPLCLGVFWKTKKDGSKTIFALIFLCLGACMIFTWSRGAWLGVFLATALFLFITDKRWALLAVVGVFLLPMLLSSGSAIADRLLSIGNTKDSSTAYRVSIWHGSINMIRDFWLSGIGLGSDAFSMIYPKYALDGANFALHAHNLFLQILAETGIMGLVTFLALILAVLRQNFSVVIYRKRKTYTGAVVLALTAGILGYLFQGLTDNVWYNYKMVLIFWTVLAITGSAAAPDFDGGGMQ